MQAKYQLCAVVDLASDRVLVYDNKRAEIKAAKVGEFAQDVEEYDWVGVKNGEYDLFYFRDRRI
jgi:hypothetical protein